MYSVTINDIKKIREKNEIMQQYQIQPIKYAVIFALFKWLMPTLSRNSSYNIHNPTILLSQKAYISTSSCIFSTLLISNSFPTLNPPTPTPDL